jgi:predicted phage-related endonuclease
MSNRLEWLQMRQQGIGGSDIAAILGQSPFKSKLEVFYDKI